MKTINRPGLRGLANPLTYAAMALAAQASSGIAQGTRVSVRGTPDTIVMKADSTRGPSLRRVTFSLHKVDSLLRIQEAVPIGSPEYARIQQDLETTIRSALSMQFIRPDGSIAIAFTPEGLREIRKNALTASQIRIDVTPRGWLGIDANGFHQDPWKENDGVYIRYFEYPTVLGVDPNSPAAKAGVRFGDTLVAYDGVDLRRNAINLTRMLEPGHELAVRLRREAETKDVTITIDKAPTSAMAERRAGPMNGVLVAARTPVADSTERRAVEIRSRSGAPMAPQGAFTFDRKAPTAVAGMAAMGIPGARLTDLEPDAIAALTQQKATHGVLVTAVAPGSPAARMGLRGGDMIISVNDIDITSMSQLHRDLMTRSSTRPMPVVVVRAGKFEKLTYEFR